MVESRMAKITIGGVDYDLLLTMRATKEIAKRYGGLENLGDKLMQEDSFEQSIDEIVWLIVTLANQPLMIEQLKNPQAKVKLLTAEEVELMATPHELMDFKDAITLSMMLGTKRNIESEEGTAKNAESE